MEAKDLMSAGEVALLFRKSLKWVYGHTAQIPGGFKLGGSWYFDREILSASLKEKALKAPSRASGDKHGLL